MIGSSLFFSPKPADNSIIDPWHTLSVQQDVNPQSPLYTYNVRGHCAAIADAEPDDPPEIKAVRAKIAANLKTWLTGTGN